MIKKTIFLLVCLLTISLCKAQEWFTSFDVAKRLALMQNKMLFVVWEEALDYPYPIIINSPNGVPITIDLSIDNQLDSLIWQHFIPVIIPESKYNELYENIKDFSTSYKEKFNDDSIKIMDVNGYILNTKQTFQYAQNLSIIINKYGLSTKFLETFLDNYLNEPNLNNAFNLAAKYVDYSIFIPKGIRPEVIGLANIYMLKTKEFLLKSDVSYKDAMLQQLELLKVKNALILGKPNKAKRLIKKVDENEIYKNNKSIHRFLKYIIFKLNKDEENARLLQREMPPVDLKRAEYIININK